MSDFEVVRYLARCDFGNLKVVRSRINGELYVMRRVRNLEFDGIRRAPERLLGVNLPMLVNTHAIFQDRGKTCVLLDYVPSVDLGTRLRDVRKMRESQVRLYAAELAVGLDSIHSHGLICHVLHPGNLLVDREGHLRISECCFLKAESMTPEPWMIITGNGPWIPEYVAPELYRLVVTHGTRPKALDWWNLGILVFEMLSGMNPFYHESRDQIYRMIVDGAVINYPPEISGHAKDFIARLIDRNPDTRLRGGPTDVDEAMHANGSLKP
jgi:serine/threonine protein kinase